MNSFIPIFSAFFILLGLLVWRFPKLIAGYNTMTPEERAAFDERALCRFWGKILLPMGAFLPMAAVGGIYDKVWPALAYLALVLGLVAFAIIYSNTGKRFRK